MYRVKYYLKRDGSDNRTVLHGTVGKDVDFDFDEHADILRDEDGILEFENNLGNRVQLPAYNVEYVEFEKAH